MRPHVLIHYVNHRGNLHSYRIQPSALQTGLSPFHPDVPYLIAAIVLEKDFQPIPPQLRTFDPARILSWDPMLEGDDRSSKTAAQNRWDRRIFKAGMEAQASIIELESQNAALREIVKGLQRRIDDRPEKSNDYAALRPDPQAPGSGAARPEHYPDPPGPPDPGHRPL